MSSPSFRFQQFEVFHDRCGMKVGTDGVLLAAWVQPGDSRRILDVGTGSGLIALIMAQHSIAEVVAVEYDAAAATQAAENVQRSPWPNRIGVLHQDFRLFEADPFDLIVSNPPFFQNSLRAPVPSRNQARHDDTLTYADLISKAASLLSEAGRLAVVLPSVAQASFEEICWDSKLYLTRCCEVISIVGQAPKRVLLEFSRHRGLTERSSLVLKTTDNAPTTAFSALTSDLYLNP